MKGNPYKIYQNQLKSMKSKRNSTNIIEKQMNSNKNQSKSLKIKGIPMKIGGNH